VGLGNLWQIGLFFFLEISFELFKPERYLDVGINERIHYLSSQDTWQLKLFPYSLQQSEQMG